MRGSRTALARARLTRAWRDGLPEPVRALLAPAAWAYRAGLAAREAAYARGVLRRGRLPCPVVSVGNLTLGGTGKTPVVELVARWLLADGWRVAVVSRGYGRQGGAPIEVVSTGAGPLVGVERAGDEPLALARRLAGAAVVVGADRLAAARRALASAGADVVLLDDGFQQRRLVKDVDVVCLDARAPWGRGGLFPGGTLREPAAALRRAHLVVVTHAGACADLPGLLGEVRRRAGGVPCLAVDYEPDGLQDLRTGARHPTEAVRRRHVLAFAGIAVPEGLVDTLTAAGATVRDLAAFPDHHAYVPADLAALAARARAIGADLLVTTEKDAVRLPGVGGCWPAGLPPLWALRVRLRPGPGEEAWRAALTARLRAVSRGR